MGVSDAGEHGSAFITFETKGLKPTIIDMREAGSPKRRLHFAARALKRAGTYSSGDFVRHKCSSTFALRCLLRSGHCGLSRWQSYVCRLRVIPHQML
jgi:hypothetical protein